MQARLASITLLDYLDEKRKKWIVCPSKTYSPMSGLSPSSSWIWASITTSNPGQKLDYIAVFIHQKRLIFDREWIPTSTNLFGSFPKFTKLASFAKSMLSAPSQPALSYPQPVFTCFQFAISLLLTCLEPVLSLFSACPQLVLSLLLAYSQLDLSLHLSCSQLVLS